MALARDTSTTPEKAEAKIRRRTDASTGETAESLLEMTERDIAERRRGGSGPSATASPFPHPSRDEIRWHLDGIREAARVVPALSAAQRERMIEAVVAFLRERLLPRAAAEEAAIYPKIARTVSPDVAALLRSDHQVIETRTAELATADPRDAPAVQEILEALHANIAAHLESEQRVYVQMLFPRDEQIAYGNRAEPRRRSRRPRTYSPS
jgi:hypothetical protein